MHVSWWKHCNRKFSDSTRFRHKSLHIAGTETAIKIDTGTKRVGILTHSITRSLSVSGDVGATESTVEVQILQESL